MGFGFRLNLKCDFPIQSHSFTNPSFRLSSSNVRGKEASFNATRQSFVSVVSEDSETLCRDPLRAYPSSPAAPQFMETNLSEMEDMKENIRKRSYSCLHNTIDDSQVPVKEDKFTSSRNLQACKASHFHLLMENLYSLEETFVDLDVLRLERDILLQLGRLGAINLFNTCLSRTLESLNVLDLSDIPSEHIGEHKMKSTTYNHIGKVIVRSGKMKERKLRRKRILENALESSFVSMPLTTIQKRFGKPTVSSEKRGSSSRSRRLKIARNEAELSQGVKVVADLERIRKTVEEETGRVASLSCWAEAAGLDEKVLQQHLHFGWYCRDELIKSTRSLVLYLARSYRGLGIALEDLLQDEIGNIRRAHGGCEHCMLGKIAKERFNGRTLGAAFSCAAIYDVSHAGNLGILQGAERFDHSRGYRFSTYVQYWIKKSMSRMVAQHARGIQIPCTLSSAIYQIEKARKALNRNHRRYPDDEDIAKHTGLSLAKIISASKCLRVVGSVDQKMGDCLNMQFRELTPDMSVRSPEETVVRQHMRNEIHDLLESLDPRQRQVLYLRYGLEDYQPKSLASTGMLLSVTKEWIRKVEKKALEKLRDEDIRINLRHYLDW